MSNRKLFGTDGIRGAANIYPMTSEVAILLGRAVTYYFQKQATHQRKPLIVVGKDTRLSCYMLEQAFTSGVCAQGGEVVLTGPLPTPAIAFVTQSMRADAGVMISASHNKFSDNGIKIFDSNGDKLPDVVEKELEDLILNPEKMPTRIGAELGNAKRLKEVFGRYVVHVKSAVSKLTDFDGLRIVLDCANGAGYKVAPMVFSEMGAELITIGVNPNGQNINDRCGSLYPELAAKKVIDVRADIGVCLDGDADRLILIDHEGEVIDGDSLIGMFAKYLLDTGTLKKGDEVVGTVMSNLGLEKYIESLGLKFIRTKVGDRYILEHMNKSGALFGGEPSGHIIFADFASTGDGTLSALKAIEVCLHYKKPLKDLISSFSLFPMEMKNIIVTEKVPFEDIDAVKKAMSKAEKDLGENGRILVRYSGTELLARVMVEGKDHILVKTICDSLASQIQSSLGK